MAVSISDPDLAGAIPRLRHWEFVQFYAVAPQAYRVDWLPVVAFAVLKEESAVLRHGAVGKLVRVGYGRVGHGQVAVVQRLKGILQAVARSCPCSPAR